MLHVYLIKNKINTFKYIGITQDLERRLDWHNQGKTRSTKFYRPFDKLIKLGVFNSRKEARVKEKYFKSGIGREQIKNTIGE